MKDAFFGHTEVLQLSAAGSGQEEHCVCPVEGEVSLSVTATQNPSPCSSRSWEANTSHLLLTFLRFISLALVMFKLLLDLLCMNMQVIAFHVHGKWISKLHL